MRTTENNLAIALTTDPTRLTKLHAKATEYEKRNEALHVSWLPACYAHYTYQQWVLERLLRFDHVELNELVTEYSTYSWYDPYALAHAFSDVEKYNNGDPR